MRALVSLSMFCIASAPLLAQAPAELAEGARVRVRSVSASGKLDRGVEGTLERSTGDTLWVRPTKGGELTAYAPSDRQQLFVYGGRASSAGKGALYGAGIGAVVGAALGFAAGTDCEGKFICFEQDESMLIGAVGVGVLGLVSGAIIGALSPHEIWRRATLSRVTPIALGAPNGVGFGLAVRF